MKSEKYDINDNINLEMDNEIYWVNKLSFINSNYTLIKIYNDNIDISNGVGNKIFWAQS